MNNKEFHTIINLLRQEIKPAIGCTEPIAVAYAVARACEILEQEPQKIDLQLSSNILKNAMGVGIPGTNMIGLPIAIALGVKVGKSQYGLEVLRDVNSQAVEDAKEYINAHDINISVKEDIDEKLYIKVKVEHNSNTAEVIIAKLHTNIVKERKNGKDIFSKEKELDSTNNTEDVKLTISKICEFANEVAFDDISFILEAGKVNNEIAEDSLSKNYGHNVGKLFHSQHGHNIFGDSIFSKIVSNTSAACDARMAGAIVPIVSNSGSGNQGIATTIPVYLYAKNNNIEDDKLARALVISALTAIYIKKSLGRLSALCGCVVAAMGSSCGITYLMGGTYTHICFAVKNMIANLTGMVCDGAKPSCSLKLSSGVSMALLSAVLAVEGQGVSALEGIIDEDVDKCIDNLSLIGRDAMNETDKMIVNIMTSK